MVLRIGLYVDQSQHGGPMSVPNRSLRIWEGDYIPPAPHPLHTPELGPGLNL